MKRFKYLTMAALVAFAACDEGEETVVAPPVTGTVSGVVTIENSGASGVTVTLSSGATATTDGSGAYAISDVPAGAYTVTISGFASDATFSSTAKAVTISSAGQVATANFDGSFVRTSAILGSVAAGGVGLANVSVTLSGMSSASTTTDANGQYSFSGLRGGTYTVAMTNPNAGQYTFATTSQSVTVAAGASEVASFSGTLLATGTISGWVYLDENDKNDNYDSGLEEALAVANIGITIEGGQVATTMTGNTDATGKFTFSGLQPGPYRVTIDAADTDIPSMVTFGDTNNKIVQVSNGAVSTADFAFDITTQTIMVGGFLGTDNDVTTTPGPRQTPIPGWTIHLYDTQSNAAAGGTTGRIGNTTTGADGIATFRFLRSVDVSPASSANDMIVFARAAGPGALGAPSATHAISGEQIIEINYAATDSTHESADELDALYNQLVLRMHAQELDADTLATWSAVLRVNKDSTFATTTTDATNANGDAFWTLAPTAFPDTVWVRLSNTQAGAGGHAFAQAPTADEGTAAGRYFRYIWNGTTAAADTIDLGDMVVTYQDVDVIVQAHHEKDDTANSGGTAAFTTLDDRTSVIATTIQMFNAGTTTSVTPVLAGTAAGLYDDGSTVTTATNLPIGSYDIASASIDANIFILGPDTITVTLDGSDQQTTINTAGGSAGTSAFGIKANNNTVSGTVLADDGSPAAGIEVTLTATAMNIEGSAEMKDTTSATGAYSFTGNVIEGPYTVMVADTGSVWAFNDSIGTGSAPNASGSASNSSANMGTRDVQGYASALAVANFQADFLNTAIHGVVVNDRDMDFNTLDPDEALIGVTINLIDDADGDGAIDTGEATLATTTTDATGAYSFTGLTEDNYIVQAVSPTGATVLRALSAAGTVTAHIGVTTEAALGVAAPTGNCALADCTAQNNTRIVGNVSPPAQNDEFPRWDYTMGTASSDGGNLGGGGPNATNAGLTIAPAHFVHLFTTGTITGTVTAGGSGVSGARVTVTRCQTAATAPSPPTAGACTLKHGVPSPHIVNVDTDATGSYTVGGLLEGVYQIDVAPATAGYTTITTPAGAPNAYLATLQGANDIETVAAFVIS